MTGESQLKALRDLWKKNSDPDIKCLIGLTRISVRNDYHKLSTKEKRQSFRWTDNSQRIDEQFWYPGKSIFCELQPNMVSK